MKTALTISFLLIVCLQAQNNGHTWIAGAFFLSALLIAIEDSKIKQ